MIENSTTNNYLPNNQVNNLPFYSDHFFKLIYLFLATLGLHC